MQLFGQLDEREAMGNCVIAAATNSDSAPLQFLLLTMVRPWENTFATWQAHCDLLR